MAKTKEKITDRERTFCEFYYLTGNVRESAIRAGFNLCPEIKGLRLLKEKRIANELENLKKQNNIIPSAKEGFARLAFGNVSDAVRLVIQGDFCGDNIDRLDLFNIAEIKRPKDGSLEIKFFDRIKALENLARLEEETENCDTSLPFYRALEESAARLS